jgi:hypothetical protein
MWECGVPQGSLYRATPLTWASTVCSMETSVRRSLQLAFLSDSDLPASTSTGAWCPKGVVLLVLRDVCPAE